jgi:hypothetical protein
MVRSKVVHFDYKAMLDIKFSNVYHSINFFDFNIDKSSSKKLIE